MKFGLDFTPVHPGQEGDQAGMGKPGGEVVFRQFGPVQQA
jgi:hypothetical protein